MINIPNIIQKLIDLAKTIKTMSNIQIICFTIIILAISSFIILPILN